MREQESGLGLDSLSAADLQSLLIQSILKEQLLRQREKKSQTDQGDQDPEHHLQTQHLHQQHSLQQQQQRQPSQQQHRQPSLQQQEPGHRDGNLAAREQKPGSASHRDVEEEGSQAAVDTLLFMQQQQQQPGQQQQSSQQQRQRPTPLSDTTRAPAFHRAMRQAEMQRDDPSRQGGSRHVDHDRNHGADWDGDHHSSQELGEHQPPRIGAAHRLMSQDPNQPRLRQPQQHQQLLLSRPQRRNQVEAGRQPRQRALQQREDDDEEEEDKRSQQQPRRGQRRLQQPEVPDLDHPGIAPMCSRLSRNHPHHEDHAPNHHGRSSGMHSSALHRDPSTHAPPPRTSQRSNPSERQLHDAELTGPFTAEQRHARSGGADRVQQRISTPAGPTLSRVRNSSLAANQRTDSPHSVHHTNITPDTPSDQQQQVMAPPSRPDRASTRLHAQALHATRGQTARGEADSERGSQNRGQDRMFSDQPPPAVGTGSGRARIAPSPLITPGTTHRKTSTSMAPFASALPADSIVNGGGDEMPHTRLNLSLPPSQTSGQQTSLSQQDLAGSFPQRLSSHGSAYPSSGTLSHVQTQGAGLNPRSTLGLRNSSSSDMLPQPQDQPVAEGGVGAQTEVTHPLDQSQGPDLGGLNLSSETQGPEGGKDGTCEPTANIRDSLRPSRGPSVTQHLVQHVINVKEGEDAAPLSQPAPSVQQQQGLQIGGSEHGPSQARPRQRDIPHVRTRPVRSRAGMVREDSRRASNGGPSGTESDEDPSPNLKPSTVVGEDARGARLNRLHLYASIGRGDGDAARQNSMGREVDPAKVKRDADAARARKDADAVRHKRVADAARAAAAANAAFVGARAAEVNTGRQAPNPQLGAVPGDAVAAAAAYNESGGGNGAFNGGNFNGNNGGFGGMYGGGGGVLVQGGVNQFGVGVGSNGGGGNVAYGFGGGFGGFGVGSAGGEGAAGAMQQQQQQQQQQYRNDDGNAFGGQAPFLLGPSQKRVCLEGGQMMQQQQQQQQQYQQQQYQQQPQQQQHQPFMPLHRGSNNPPAPIHVRLPACCKVPGCQNALDSVPQHKRRVCEFHYTALHTVINSCYCRYCRWCHKFQASTDFDGDRTHCAAAMRARNSRRRQRRQAMRVPVPPTVWGDRSLVLTGDGAFIGGDGDMDDGEGDGSGSDLD